MAGYNEIRGLRVKYLSADPAGAEDGQVWYNSTTGNLRVQGVGVASLSSASPVSTARLNAAAGGTNDASWFAGGYEPSASNKTEEYNGSGWSSGGNLSTARGGLIGTGIQTAGLAMGGGPGSAPYTSAVTEEYNGSAWTGGGTLNVERIYSGAGGTQTAGVIFAGQTTPNASVRTTSTEEYNGTAWTTIPGGNVNSGQGHVGGCGTQTAALKAGGDTPGGSSNNSEEYDGATWTATGNLNTARRADGLSGLQTAGVLLGGYAPPGAKNSVETYDGSTWSTSPATLASATYYNTTSGNTNGTGLLSISGNGPSLTAAVEEYNFSTSTVTPSVWSSGGTMPNSANQKNGSGILTAAFAVGGETPPGAVVNNTDEYDGTNWTSGGVINSARGDVMSGGTLTAGLIMGGFQNTGTFLFSETEEYNGTAWSEVNNMPTGAYSGSGTGTQTAAFVNNMYIGSPGERTNVTYEYDGTNWSSGGNTAETTNSRSSVGTLTAGLTVGGRPAPATYISDTELYNGTAWTAGVDMIQPFQAGGQSSKGTQTSCIIFGSPKSPVNTMTYEFDGTSWYTQPNLGTYQNKGTGTATSALAFGVSNTSQEWQAGSTTENPARNITTS